MSETPDRFSWEPIITLWRESFDTTFDEGYLPAMIAVLADADLANTSSAVRELRAKVLLSEVVNAMYPRRIILGVDPKPTELRVRFQNNSRGLS